MNAINTSKFKYIQNFILIFCSIFFFSNITYSNCVTGNCENGLGTYKIDSFEYIGQFKNNLFNGQGTIIFSDGNTYVGSFKDDKYNGYGIFIFSGGNKYSGNFINGEYSDGTFIFSSGDKYEGQFENNKRHGSGKFFHKNGDIYIGEFKNDNYHGSGKYTYINGDVYEGSYQNGEKNGYGITYFNNGNIYKGEFLNGEYHGYGVYSFTSGDIYEGKFENSKFNGQGKYTYYDGTIEEGIFENNELISSNANNLINNLFNLELTNNSVRDFFENSGIDYESIEFSDENSFTIKNIKFEDELSIINIEEVTILNFDYNIFKIINTNQILNTNIFDKFIIKNYSYKDSDNDHFIQEFEISKLKIRNINLLSNIIDEIDNFKSNNLTYIFNILDSTSFNKVKINGATIREAETFGKWDLFEITNFKKMNFENIILTDYYFDESDYEQRGTKMLIKNLSLNRFDSMPSFNFNNPEFIFSIFRSLDSFIVEDVYHLEKFENFGMNASSYEISDYKTIDIGEFLLPISFKFKFNNALINELDPEFMMYLSLFDYDNLVFDFSIGMNIDKISKDFNLNINSLFEDAFEIDTNLLLTNFDINNINLNNDDELIKYFSNDITFDLLEVEIIDKGLTNRVLEHLNTFYNIDKSQVEYLLLEIIKNDNNLGNSIDNIYINKILKFINNPNSINFIINPINGITYNDFLLGLTMPEKLVKELNIKIN